MSNTGNEFYKKQLSTDQKKIYEQIFAGIQKHMMKIPVALISYEQIQKAYEALLLDHPELFFVDGASTLSQKKLGTKITEQVFSPKYNLSIGDIQGVQRRIEAKTNPIVAQAKKYRDDYERVKYIYEQIILHTDYVANAPQNQNIQSVFLYGKSVCSGYSRAFQYLLDRSGMEAAYISGMGNGKQRGPHAWNLVKINGAYCWFDITWGDPVFENGKQNADYISYHYFALPDAAFLKEHKPDATYRYPSCTTAQYGYYQKSGNSVGSYDANELYQLYTKAILQGKSAEVKFESATAYQMAKKEITQQTGAYKKASEFFMKKMKKNRCSMEYRCDDQNYHLEIGWK